MTPEEIADRAIEYALDQYGNLRPPMDNVAARALIRLLKEHDLAGTDRQAAWDRLHEQLLARADETRTPAVAELSARPRPERPEPAPDPDRIVADVLHTTLDGTAKRFRYLSGVAADRLEAACDAAGTGWLERRRLRRALGEALARERDRCVDEGR